MRGEKTIFLFAASSSAKILLHSYILVRKKLEKRLCLTGTRGHFVNMTKITPKKGTKKAETLKFFEHFD